MKDIRNEDKLSTYTRRHFLGLVLGAAGTGMLAACGSSPQATTNVGTNTTPNTGSAPSGASTSGVTSTPTTSGLGTSSTQGASMTPGTTGTVSASGVIPSPAPGVPVAYYQYPSPQFKSVAKVPGESGPLRTVTTFQGLYGSPPPAMGKNPYWQELNKRLGVTYKAQEVPNSDYDDKFATTLAGGDLPNLMVYYGTGTQPQALQQGAFTDLTDYLTGDAVKEYPNLARLSAGSWWKKSRINGRMYGVPCPTPYTLTDSQLLYRPDWAKKLGVDNPRNADDFEKMMIAFTKQDPDGNGKTDTWGAIPSYQRWNLGFYQLMFRVPNNWQLNKDGTLVKDLETAEFKAAIAYAIKLYKEGIYDPTSPNTDYSKIAVRFTGSKVGSYLDGPGSLISRRDQLAQAGHKNDAIGVVIPPGHDGGKGVSYNGQGYYGIAMIPSSTGKDKAKIQELLRILDYFAAPFGSEEALFLDYGIKGRDYIMKPGGPLPTSQAVEIDEIKRVMRQDTWDVIYYGPDQYFNTDEQGKFAREVQDMYAKLLPIGLDDPTQGYYSATSTRKGPELDQLQTDSINSIVTGRAPLSSWDQTVKKWRSQGGDQIRKEYQQALQKAAGS